MRPTLLATLYAFVLVLVFPALAGAKDVPKGGAAKDAAKPAPAILDSWVRLQKGESGARMKGSTGDVRMVRAQQQGDESLLWARRGDQAWIIRDPAVLAKVDVAWAPTDAQGKKMEALGKQMEGHGKKMELLGHRMEQAKSNAEREALSQQMEAVSKDMDGLSKQMDALAREMDALVARAEVAMAALVDDAIRAGKATPAKSAL